MMTPLASSPSSLATSVLPLIRLRMARLLGGPSAGACHKTASALFAVTRSASAMGSVLAASQRTNCDKVPIMISSLWCIGSSGLNYRSGISCGTSQDLQMRYAKMRDVDWDDLRFFLAVSERDSISGAADFHSTLLRRITSLKKRLGSAVRPFAAPMVDPVICLVRNMSLQYRTILLTQRRARYESVSPGISWHDPVGLGRSHAGVEFLARLRSSVRLAPFRCGAHGLRPQRASDQQFRGCLD